MLISLLPLFIYHLFWSWGKERSSENIFQSLQKTQPTVPPVIYLRKNTMKCLCYVLLVAWLKQSSVASLVWLCLWVPRSKSRWRAKDLRNSWKIGGRTEQRAPCHFVWEKSCSMSFYKASEKLVSAGRVVSQCHHLRRNCSWGLSSATWHKSLGRQLSLVSQNCFSIQDLF